MDVGSHIDQAREILSRTAGFLGDRDSVHQSFSKWDLYAADAALSDAAAKLRERCAAGEEAMSKLQASALQLQAAQLQLTLKDTLLTVGSSRINAAHRAIHRLRDTRSLKALTERAPREVYEIGFTRVLFSRLENGIWYAYSAFVGDDAEQANTMVEAGLSNPRRLTHVLPECEMVRRGTPILVLNAVDDPRVYPELNNVTRSVGYVAAPVFSWGSAVGLLHADHHTGVQGVHELDRDVLGAFAEGLGTAFERNSLLERLRSMRQAASDYLQTANALADDFTVDVLDLAGPATPVAESMLTDEFISPPNTGRRAGPDSLADLTAREREVLKALATGRTNAQIAATLFVSEGTVKSHVKRILRKTGASTRTEAVSMLHRGRSATSDAV
ncbi:hypothetical protein H7H74_04200 [Mycolicibacterium chitae]|nr:hypothetical protein [Mycolicibacterium chitae]